MNVKVRCVEYSTSGNLFLFYEYTNYDEGRTWPVKKTILSGLSAYSSMTVLPDGTIGIVVEEGKWDDSLPGADGFKLWFVRFTLSWLMSEN